MCSIQDGSSPPKAKNTLSIFKKCMKCERPAVTTARTKDPFCKECFNAYFVHRFRATFGKVRLFTTGERVLLAFSGGVNSRVLLGLAEEGLRLSAYKKLRFEPTAVIIDEGAVLGEEWSKRCQQLSQCLAIAMATGFCTIYTHIEQVFGECVVYHVDKLLKDGAIMKGGVRHGECKGEDVGGDMQRKIVEEDRGEAKVPSDCDDVERGDGGEEYEKLEQKDDETPQEEMLYRVLVNVGREEGLEQQIRAVFTSCQSVTAQENMLISLRRRLLVEVARKQGFSKVLVGDNATRLAVRLLGDVAQGRGRTIPLDTGFIDDRATDVLLIRPLREFPANEVVMYATFNGLHSVSIPHLTTLEPEHTSIERLTESFVAGLQVDFPSTVSTVFRTGDKLTVGGDTQLLCALCQAPTGPPADPTVFTHLSQVDTCDRDVWTRLCYGCQLTVKDMKYDSSSLPPFVQNSNSMETRVDIHSRIADSLLEETNS